MTCCHTLNNRFQTLRRGTPPALDTIMQDTQIATVTDEFGIQTTVRMEVTHSGMYKVSVIHKFPSGNFMGETFDNQSKVAATGLLRFYTS